MSVSQTAQLRLSMSSMWIRMARLPGVTRSYFLHCRLDVDREPGNHGGLVTAADEGRAVATVGAARRRDDSDYDPQRRLHQARTKASALALACSHATRSIMGRIFQVASVTD